MSQDGSSDYKATICEVAENSNYLYVYFSSGDRSKVLQANKGYQELVFSQTNLKLNLSHENSPKIISESYGEHKKLIHLEYKKSFLWFESSKNHSLGFVDLECEKTIFEYISSHLNEVVDTEVK